LQAQLEGLGWVPLLAAAPAAAVVANLVEAVLVQGSNYFSHLVFLVSLVLLLEVLAGGKAHLEQQQQEQQEQQEVLEDPGYPVQPSWRLVRRQVPCFPSIPHRQQHPSPPPPLVLVHLGVCLKQSHHSRYTHDNSKSRNRSRSSYHMDLFAPRQQPPPPPPQRQHPHVLLLLSERRCLLGLTQAPLARAAAAAVAAVVVALITMVMAMTMGMTMGIIVMQGLEEMTRPTTLTMCPAAEAITMTMTMTMTGRMTRRMTLISPSPRTSRSTGGVTLAGQQTTMMLMMTIPL
jgi:hypothetical protein